MEFIEVTDRGTKGKGVRAMKSFDPGEIVLTFEGKKIVPEPGEHTLQIGLGEHLVVEAPGRYVNHSCTPNCGIVGKLCLVAMRPIAKDEEITFDYAMTELSPVSQRTKCLCGTKRCRGRMTGFNGLSKALKNEYGDYISDYLREYEIEQTS